MKTVKMTKTELETMHVLWESREPLSIKEIPTINPSLNGNTVAVAIKKLLNKGFIQVASITYHGAALTRLFEAVISQEQYFIESLEAENIPVFDVIANFVQSKCSPEEIEELENIINTHKKTES